MGHAGWNKSETSRHFLVSDDTIRDWLRRVDDDALVQTSTPVNRFPDVVRYAVQQIKLFCPTHGKLKIAEKLARAGMPPLHRAATFRTGQENRKWRGDRRRVEKGRANSLRLYSPFSTLLLYCRRAAIRPPGSRFDRGANSPSGRLDFQIDLPTRARMLVGAECDRSFLTTIPEDQTAFERELGLIIDWYNEHRPHETLDGKTPNEVHYAPGRQRTATFRATQKMATRITLRGARSVWTVILGTRSSSKSTASTASSSAGNPRSPRRVSATVGEHLRTVCASPRQPVSEAISSTTMPHGVRPTPQPRTFFRIPLNKNTR